MKQISLVPENQTVVVWMKRTLVILSVAFIGAVGALSFNGRAQTTSKITWEYKVISTYGPSETNPAPNVPQLDTVGTEGWELIQVRAGEFPNPGSKQVRTDYYFKRPK
jgi:hypothetical protein